MTHIFKITFGIFIVLIGIPVFAYAQNGSTLITGNLKNKEGAAIEYASISVEGTNIFSYSDNQGAFELSLEEGSYTIQIQCLGYSTLEKKITVSKRKKIPLGDVILETSAVSLDEVVVSGNSVAHNISVAPIKATVIETKEIKQRPVTITEMLNRTTGIRVRQSGGLGSFTNVMMNGFQGNSVRIFKDGIPLDYLQGGIGLNNIPVNILSRVEVYKGVLPADLSADALGGAINLVSQKRENKQVAFSYEIASFNTHQATLNVSVTSPDKRFFVGGDAFFNYSDNNYKVIAPVVDEETANIVPTKLPLFHNAYKHYFTEVYAGVANTVWADEIRFSMSLFSIQRDNQFASLMEKPFGAVLSKRNAYFVPTIHYTKSLLDSKLNVDQFASYSIVNTAQIDTLRGRYDWYGKYHPAIDDNTIGESSATLSDMKMRSFVSRTNLAYRLNEHHRFVLNAVVQSSSQKGSDIYGTTIQDSDGREIDLLSLPSDYSKLIGALGYQSDFFDKRLHQNTQIKYYASWASGRSVNLSTGRLNEDILDNSNSQWGISTALKWELNSRSFIRASGEVATRLPEQREIFGDASFLLPNFDLKPERSTNINLGYAINKPESFSFEFNGFYRLTENLISKELTGLLFSQNVNVEKVNGLGLELDATAFLFPWLRWNGNTTYQNFRLRHLNDPSVKYLEGARLPNIPFFFANTGLRASFNHVFMQKDRVELFYHYSYVHKYFLRYIPKDAEPDGFLGLFGESKVNTKDIIPSQNLHSFGFSWSPATDSQWMFGGEIKNIFNTAVYDNFRIQNAGRSAHLKVSFKL
ncbi:TonB-dependent receptor [Massilibacteroides sp.]|uniref:TonB-dependent receptor n=1 Tax=Massilibacteroides sp. TaxID=2034766 RepID=UPI002612185E|nr:TonB-dependent receptor [Massilibacteroides sp.]MDD4513949.1 TonB-dependent receptor [Massilibacteroides sp.]